MELHWCDTDVRREKSPGMWDEGDMESLGDEDRVDIAFETSEDVCTQVVNRADKVFRSHEEVREKEANDDGADPGTDEACRESAHNLNQACLILTFDRLLGRDLDKLRPSKRDSTNVGKDVVDDDQAHGQEEPDHALEDIVHDEVRLHHDQVQSHVSPSELGELELVMAFLQRSNEEHEA